MDTSQIFLTPPVADGICKNLTFQEANSVRLALNFSELNCSVPVRDLNQQILFFNKVNNLTVEAAKSIEKFGSNHALIDFASKGNLEMVKLLVNSGANVGHISAWTKKDPVTSALAPPFSQNKLKIVEFLVEKGADVNRNYENSFSLLHWAVVYGHSQIVEFLLAKEAEVNRIDGKRNTALMLTYADNYLESAKLLIQYGADISLTNRSGKTALMLAAEYNDDLDIFKFLFDQAATQENFNIDQTDNDRETALSLAAIKGRLNIVKFLVSHGANVNHVNANGLTPLMMASLTGYSDTIKFLLEKGANINAVTPEGKTSLMFAVINGRIGLVKILLENEPIKVDIHAVDRDGQTALMMAENLGFSNIVQLLKFYGA